VEEITHHPRITPETWCSFTLWSAADYWPCSNQISARSLPPQPSRKRQSIGSPVSGEPRQRAKSTPDLTIVRDGSTRTRAA